MSVSRQDQDNENVEEPTEANEIIEEIVTETEEEIVEDPDAEHDGEIHEEIVEEEEIIEEEIVEEQTIIEDQYAGTETVIEETGETAEDEAIVTEEEVLVGKWDCDTCDFIGNAGDSYSCHGCSAPRSEDVKFYLGDSPRKVTDAAGIASAEAGHDWYCRYCDSGNSNLNSTCSNCGADKGSSKHHKIKAPKERTVKEQVAQKAAQKKTKSSASVFIGVGAALMMMFFCCLILAAPSGPSNVKVAAAKWTVDCRTNQYIEVNDWTLTPPTNAQKAAVSEGIPERIVEVGKEKVVDHYKDVPFEEEYQVKVGEKEAIVSHKKVQDGTERKIVRHDKVADGTKQVQDGTKKVPDGYKTVTKTRKVKTGTKKVKIGTKKVLVSKERVIVRYKTKTETKNLGNGRFKKITKKVPVYGYKKKYEKRDVYKTEPVYKTETYTERIQKYKEVPNYKTETIYKEVPVYADVPKYKQVPVYGKVPVMETRTRTAYRKEPVYVMKPIMKKQYKYQRQELYRSIYRKISGTGFDMNLKSGEILDESATRSKAYANLKDPKIVREEVKIDKQDLSILFSYQYRGKEWTTEQSTVDKSYWLSFKKPAEYVVSNPGNRATITRKGS